MVAKWRSKAFCNTFDLHKAIIGLENQFLVFFLSGRLRQVLQLQYNVIMQVSNMMPGVDAFLPLLLLLSFEFLI